MGADLPTCHVCGGGAEDVPGYGRLGRVTSDCKPWPSGGRLSHCRRCGVVQKAVDEGWRAEAARIYGDYASYHQSGGEEQAVFTADGAAAPRSSVLLRTLRARVGLPARGTLLDVGCGIGVTLRAAAAELEGWSLVGTDLDDRNRDRIEAIPGVTRLHVGPPADIPQTFSVVSLVHVFEHIEDPIAFLRGLAAVVGDGLLLIQTPDLARNPFDLLVADHASHFTLSTLTAVVRRAGFEIVEAADDWLAKELTVVARVSEAAADGSWPDPAAGIGLLRGHLEWLDRVETAARSIADVAIRGVFGTSIAGTWLWQQLTGEVGFFVDEDPSRQGITYLGRSVVAPAEVPAGSAVVLALPWALARRVAERLADASRRYVAVDERGDVVVFPSPAAA